MQFSQKTHRVFFHRGMMQINGLRGCMMKREKRERRQINIDRAVIEKKKSRRFQLIVQAWGWMTILSLRCLFLLLPSSFFPLWLLTCQHSSAHLKSGSTVKLPLLFVIAYSKLAAGHHSSYLCKSFFVWSYGGDASWSIQFYSNPAKANYLYHNSPQHKTQWRV